MRTTIFLLLIAGCTIQPIAPTAPHAPTYADTLAMIDTAYADPTTGHIRPPCSMTPDYCACMRGRGARECQ